MVGDPLPAGIDDRDTVSDKLMQRAADALGWVRDSDANLRGRLSVVEEELVDHRATQFRDRVEAYARDDGPSRRLIEADRAARPVEPPERLRDPGGRFGVENEFDVAAARVAFDGRARGRHKLREADESLRDRIRRMWFVRQPTCE
jgi:hypothetical protein